MALAASAVITLRGAKQAAEASLVEAEKLGLKVAVAICDAGGHPLVVYRTDGVMPASSEISMQKARSAALFARETKLLEGSVNGEKSSGSERAALLSSGFVLMEGGVPITDPASGRIIGACGVSGAKPQEDAAVAKAGVAALAAVASKL
uniref:Heme-binding protein n=1 Tax=Alexandrium catenella TaxID=2925 RepID=A0A7S1RXX0_ALECA|mmetsp:Transcript_78087/g.207225  ORF Transcript_78087/g.207225 Transcript_78087/m.207225 type:complete len:149 (-) Transcript_78087:68-514(-)